MFNAIFRRGVQLGNSYVCLSTDEKDENNKGNGDMLIEMDTGNVYFFDADAAEGSKWIMVNLDDGGEG